MNRVTPTLEAPLVIFNLYAVLEVILVVVPTFIVFFAAAFLGVPNELLLWVLAGGLAFGATVDGLWRTKMVVEEETTLYRLLLPNRGGHVMFVPVWLYGTAGTALLTYINVLIAWDALTA